MPGWRAGTIVALALLAAGCGRGGAGNGAAGEAAPGVPAAPGAVTSTQTAPAAPAANAAADLDLPREALSDPLSPGQMPMMRLGLWEVVQTVAGQPPQTMRQCRRQTIFVMPPHPGSCERLGFHRTPSGGLMAVADCAEGGERLSLRTRSEGDFSSRFTTHSRIEMTQSGTTSREEIRREERYIGDCPAGP